MKREIRARGYEILVECWGPGVEHKKPVLDLHFEPHGLSVLIADDYDHLEAVLLKMLEKVRERAKDDNDG